MVVLRKLEDSLKRFLEAYTFLVPIALVLIFLDQWTKSIVRDSLTLQESWMPVAWLAPYVRIVNWQNTGAAFGIFQGLNGVFTVISFVIILAILLYFPQIPENDHFFRLALTMQLGGAAGNLIDRLSRGYVTDFISVGRFPVFNIADSCITLGVVVLMIGVWMEERRKKDE